MNAKSRKEQGTGRVLKGFLSLAEEQVMDFHDERILFL